MPLPILPILPRRTPSLRRWALRSVLLISVACQPESASVPTPSSSPAFARPAGGGPTALISVTSTSPAVAPQDTIIDVVINGSGFAMGAAATWALLGDTTLVHVLSTSYVNSKQLKARVQVPAGAPVGKYDVLVYIDGKKGVGAELFEVLLGDPKTMWTIPLDDRALGLRSDRMYSDGSASVYDDGVCGVSSRLYSTTSASNSGDATLQTDNPRTKSVKCVAYPRKFTVVYDNGIIDTRPAFMNLRGIENTVYSIPIDSTRLHGLTVTLSGTGPGCSALRWNSIVQGATVAGDRLLVTRTTINTWTVQSQPSPNNRAYCVDNGNSYQLNVRFTVVKRTLP